MTKRTCPQCRFPRPPSHFLSDAPGAQCSACRAHYRLPPGQRPVREWRSDHPTDEPLKVRFIRYSANRKTGPIPVTTSSPSTCPPSCSWYGAGCYAEHHHIGHRWRNTSTDPLTLTWEEFCQEIEKLPPGQLWRHNEAGDLPGVGEDIDRCLLQQLVQANRGRRGFTFSHKRDLAPLVDANRQGFTINLSCDSQEEVIDFKQRRVKLPLVVTVPSTDTRKNWVKQGVHFTTCPAQTTDGMTCERCGLCAQGNRKTVIAFRAHGQSATSMDKRLVQLGLPLC